VREAVFARVEQQLPAIVEHLTAEIGENIDQLIDAKLMVISYFEAHPQLICDLFQVIGKKELRFMQNFGFYFGYPDGLPARRRVARVPALVRAARRRVIIGGPSTTSASR